MERASRAQQWGRQMCDRPPACRAAQCSAAPHSTWPAGRWKKAAGAHTRSQLWFVSVHTETAMHMAGWPESQQAMVAHQWAFARPRHAWHCCTCTTPPAAGPAAASVTAWQLRRCSKRQGPHFSFSSAASSASALARRRLRCDSACHTGRDRISSDFNSDVCGHQLQQHGPTPLPRVAAAPPGIQHNGQESGTSDAPPRAACMPAPPHHNGSVPHSHGASRASSHPPTVQAEEQQTPTRHR